MNIANQFLLGRYSRGNSIIHKLDARVKIFFLVLISLSLFITKQAYDFIYPLAVLILVVLISRIKIMRLLRGIVPILWLVSISFALHSLIPPKNIEYALEISLRLILLFCWATVLTATTEVMELGKAVSWFLKPLKIFKLSPESIALTFSLALRFFPIILEEADSILKAQRLRNKKLGFIKKLESFCTVFLIRVLRRAQGIEQALLNRNIDEKALKKINVFKKPGYIEAAVMLAGILYLYIFLRVV
ncbi:energy-coupling factor transporter transmembrane component T family protein [Elusimicrobiota bacterium]